MGATEIGSDGGACGIGKLFGKSHIGGGDAHSLA
jgi:hypothetical protein